jgi:hypothetical protein
MMRLFSFGNVANSEGLYTVSNELMVTPVQSISESDIMPASYANTSYANLLCQLMPTTGTKAGSVERAACPIHVPGEDAPA